MRSTPVPRYHFGDFILSPRRRLLLRAGREQPLIPRYFDLLVFLIEHRHEAVHRREIFDRVWSDVIVSDSALSQAIRTIRRTLGDDPREPRFVRTVSRHGYRFVFADVREEADDDAWPAGETADTAARSGEGGGDVLETVTVGAAAVEDTARDEFEALLQRLTQRAGTALEEEDQRDAAERLHAIGTAEALQRLGTRPRHAVARALLRDTRWDVPAAGPVPLVGEPGALAAAAALTALRLRRAARVAAARWAGASAGGGLAGIVAGALGGLILSAAPGSDAPPAVAVVLGFVGGACGAAGGAGVGAGLSIAEASARSRRAIAVPAGAAIGGLCVGAVVQWIGRWSLAALVGVQVPLGGAFEGFVLGAAAGIGYAAATRRSRDGLAAPRGAQRMRVALVTALACGLGALALTLGGRPLVGGTIHAIAEASQGAQVMLTPLGQLIGDPGFGRLSRVLIGTGEGALFGLGFALGLTRRR